MCLSALGAILAAQLATGLWLDGPGLLARFADARRVLAAADARTTPVDLLIVGSSRLAFSVDASALEARLREHFGADAPEVFQAAIPAGDAIAHDWLGPRLAERGIRPRLAVVEIAPESFALYNRWLNFHVTRQFTWLDLAYFLPDIARRGSFGRVLATRLAPVFYYRYELLLAAFGRPPPYLVAPQPERASPERSEEDVRRHRLEATQDDLRSIRRWLRGYTLRGHTAEAYERVLERLTDAGTAIVLVQPPVTRAYAALYSDDVETRYAEHVLELITRYDAEYVDLRDRLPDDDFYDSHHTTELGREAFTPVFADEAVIPALERLGYE